MASGAVCCTGSWCGSSKKGYSPLHPVLLVIAAASDLQLYTTDKIQR